MVAETDDAAGRAHIEPMLSEEQRGEMVYTPLCRQRWGQRNIEGATPLLKDEDIEEFLTEFAWLKETELALQCLFDGEFDVPKAVALLHSARREKFKARRDQDERLPSEIFKDAIMTYGKKFHLVKLALGEKVITRDVVSKYYMWKRTDDYKEWWKHEKAKKTRKTKKEAVRLRQWAYESDPETEVFLGYHNRHCELCATGGSLLCCDGCARAYHISCAQPPITKLRKCEDWYCSHCQKAFEGPKPKLMPSNENEYCMICRPLPGAPRSLIESMIDASRHEEEDDQKDENRDGASSESSDDSNTDDNDGASIEELSSNARSAGSLTDNESDAKIPSSSSTTDISKTELKSGPTVHPPARKRQSSEPEILPTKLSTIGLKEHSADSPPVGARRAPPAQLERSGSVRKRHRKMLAPRRIPPSRFGSC